ncbi:DUF6998 domain-containing protein [Leisingera sp. NJS204]|uniref:DUF6998 domain-containing protein n=1 Tax=Leisingera sp. NJS204 TaxID=2508307 RepID=UPI0010116051|nr:hypothetical protein [Leisingera sp. NJS204]QAX29948.1 hypothetical protein ETW24_11540 [Leisingera sp. NJS204]
MGVFLNLPEAVKTLFEARAKLEDEFAGSGLKFTLDGKLVGDIGEAIASRAFGLKITANNSPGIDATIADGRTVQIKATGDPKGAAHFRPHNTGADFLIVLLLDYKKLKAEIVYNGPEACVRTHLNENTNFASQRPVSLRQLRVMQEKNTASAQLPLVRYTAA